MLFTDHVEQATPARKGKRHVLRVIRELLYHSPRRRRTDVGAALEFLSRVQTRRAVVFLISDFQSPDFSRQLRVVRRRHDLIPVMIGDVRERTLPSVGWVELVDPESGEQVLLNTSSKAVRERYQQLAIQRREVLIRTFRRLRIDPIDVSTGESFVEPLRRFFHQRGQRR